MELTPHCAKAVTDLSTHTWMLSRLLESSTDAEVAALLGRLIMRYRCRNRQDIYALWEARAEGSTEGEEEQLELLKVLIATGVGLPDSPRSDNHVQAFVAEHFWYFLILEHDDPRPTHVEGPSFEVTEIGSDGLELYRMETGELAFRLWEIKKHVAEDPVSRSVRTAYGQLQKNALKYLARYVTIRQHDPSDEIGTFFSHLAEHWVRESAEAAIGVSVAISEESIPSECFTTLQQHFPNLLDPPRCRGLLSSTRDFELFSDLVKAELWKGL